MSRGQRYAGRSPGMAVTELALVFPLLFLLFVGILDFGRVFYTTMAITHGARAGVQYGAQDDVTSGDFDGMRQAALDALGDVTGVTMTACRFCQCADGTPSSCGCGTDTCNPGCLAGCMSSQAPQVYVRVTVDKVFTPLFPYPGLPGTTDLNRQATMRVQ